MKTVKVYLSGIVHGSSKKGDLYDQKYRDRIREALQKKYKDVKVYSPMEAFDQESLDKMEAAENAFFHLIEQALTSDLVIAYLPAASMGSAIEIWEAYKNSKPIIVISPLEENWTVRFLSTHVCRDLDEFINFVESPEMDAYMLDRYSG